MVLCVTGGPGPERHRLSHEHNYDVKLHHGALHRLDDQRQERLREDRRRHAAAAAGRRSLSRPRLVLITGLTALRTGRAAPRWQDWGRDFILRAVL